MLILLSLNLSSQTIEDLDFGTDSTLEIMTWNIEEFPKNGSATVSMVKQIIENIEVDIIAFQEITDTVFFNQIANGLSKYVGYYNPVGFTGLAYFYKPDVIEIIDIYEIFSTDFYSRAFPRAPLVMEFKYLGEKYFVINNHLKCCGDGILNLADNWDEEKRRLDACYLLKYYLDNTLASENAIVVGDFNDELTDETENNIFRDLLNNYDNYFFVDYGIANGSSSNWSYAGWPSHLDHILINEKLFDDFNHPNADIQTIKIDNYLSGGWSQYDYYVSDHRPVAIKLQPDYNSVDELDNKLFIKIFPNPTNGQLTIESKNIKSIVLFDIAGKILMTENWSQTSNVRNINISNVNTGIYFLKVSTDNGSLVRKLILE